MSPNSRNGGVRTVALLLSRTGIRQHRARRMQFSFLYDLSPLGDGLPVKELMYAVIYPAANAR
jgi:hypothetical protein